jgi:mRNA interferase RelE/StbE
VYRVDLRARAEKEIDTLAPALKRRVLEAIAALAVDPRPVGVQKLAANGGYRVRVGDYRIVFEIDDERQCATVVRVRHRRDVYR